MLRCTKKNADGQWEQIIATPGFIGLDGLGDANINDCYTPVGTFTIDKAFGLADDPGCQMEYTKVDDNYYWSGDAREGMHFNELVNINDVFPVLIQKAVSIFRIMTMRISMF